MTRSSSSTSSSDLPLAKGEERATVRGAIKALLWTVVCLVAADLATSRTFRAPASPTVEPSNLQRYFEYGRSAEGKLRRMVRPDDDESAPIVRAGWLRNPEFAQEPKRATGPGHVLVAAYGQSFTNHIIEQAVGLDPRIDVRSQGGPGAPLSHSYALYQRDRKAQEAQIVVIGVLASVLPELATVTPMTWGFENPTPYMYPRYHLVDGRLESIPAPIETLADFRATLADPARWAALRQLLVEQDAAFDGMVFDQDIFDHSSLGRLVRRALGHQRQVDFTARYHDASGFKDRDQILDVARALLLDFGRTAVADGRLPFVFLFDDRGYPGHLDAALADTLDKAGIPYLSSDGVAPASDLNNFIGNGHFTPEIDRRIAKLWLDRLYQLRPAFRPAGTH
jgi:hypothetical protein